MRTSIQHHKREQYVCPGVISSILQPAKNIGKHARLRSMSFWSMHALSSQMDGSRPSTSSNAFAHLLNARHFSSPGSLHELCALQGGSDSGAGEWGRMGSGALADISSS